MKWDERCRTRVEMMNAYDVLIGNRQGHGSFEKSMHTCEENIKHIFEEQGVRGELDSTASEYGVTSDFFRL
jgi:hypothetical protein